MQAGTSLGICADNGTRDDSFQCNEWTNTEIDFQIAPFPSFERHLRTSFARTEQKLVDLSKKPLTHLRTAEAIAILDQTYSQS